MKNYKVYTETWDKVLGTHEKGEHIISSSDLEMMKKAISFCAENGAYTKYVITDKEISYETANGIMGTKMLIEQE